MEFTSSPHIVRAFLYQNDCSAINVIVPIDPRVRFVWDTDGMCLRLFESAAEDFFAAWDHPVLDQTYVVVAGVAGKNCGNI